MKKDKFVKVYFHNVAFMFLCSLLFAIFVSVLMYNVATPIVLAMDLDKSANLEQNNEPLVFEKTVIVEKEIEKEVYVDGMSMKNLGKFYLTAYCPCSKCCGQWGGDTVGKTGSIGVGVYDGVTVAVDPSVIPYGTKLYIEGVGVCIATDCGGGIKGNRIDVYCEDHNYALELGIFGGYGHTVYALNNVK